jgi:polysaccharide deacetylase 2 family uncharacterized protein YibQ
MRPSSAMAAIALGCIVTLNAYTALSRDTLPRQAEITLAAAAPDVAALTGSVAPQTRPVQEEPQVQIVYGDGSGPDDGAAPAAIPQSKPDIREGRVSEGGPQVIVVRDPTAANVGQSRQVAHLPDDAAIEDTEWGALPVRATDGRRPLDIYGRPWSNARGKRIALVIGGLGLSQTGTQRALKTLPPEITLAFAPQGNSLNRWMTQARKRGHELLVQVPMEPFGYPQNDPGPQTLTIASSEEDNLENLRWALGQITNYTGIVNYQGARFVGDDTAITPVLRELGQRGLLYLNDGTAGNQRMDALARAFDVPYVSGEVVIDVNQDPASIKAQLKELENLATANGYAIGTGSALEATVEAVASWANDAKKRGFEIVGVSAIAR